MTRADPSSSSPPARKPLRQRSRTARRSPRASARARREAGALRVAAALVAAERVITEEGPGAVVLLGAGPEVGAAVLVAVKLGPPVARDHAHAACRRARPRHAREPRRRRRRAPRRPRRARRGRCEAGRGRDSRLAGYLHSPAMKVGIIGLGYVGLPLAVAFAEAGHDVVGLDADPRKVEAPARAARATSRTCPSRALAAARRALRGHHATTRSSPTATRSSSASRRRSPTSASPTSATRRRGRPARPASCSEGQLVVLESTTYPGTTRERLLPILEESGLAAGARLPPRLLAGADRPRPHRLHDPHHPEGGRRADRRRARERGRRALRRDLRRGRAASRRPRRPS